MFIFGCLFCLPALYMLATFIRYFMYFESNCFTLKKTLTIKIRMCWRKRNQLLVNFDSPGKTTLNEHRSIGELAVVISLTGRRPDGRYRPMAQGGIKPERADVRNNTTLAMLLYFFISHQHFPSHAS